VNLFWVTVGRPVLDRLASVVRFARLRWMLWRGLSAARRSDADDEWTENAHAAMQGMLVAMIVAIAWVVMTLALVRAFLHP